ncbi:hypothetical protein [Corynebacterium sp.]|uniref:hypothetical protein n=1 Tax=Corynebacterium sp. TaxID=1720 RepID=UPI003B3B9C71
MKTKGLAGFTRRRRVKTTVADPMLRVFAALINRKFTAADSNQVYVGGSTCLPIADGAEHVPGHDHPLLLP